MKYISVNYLHNKRNGSTTSAELVGAPRPEPSFCDKVDDPEAKPRPRLVLCVYK